MSKNPTPEQALAINTIKSNVSLLAGAGSGKTYVLMKRFVQILRSDLSVNPTNIVAITFTRKAADEIKGRVRQAVGECVEQAQTDLERLRWQEHLQKVESAPISTIHSLCSRILRDNPVETQLDPEFTILEDFEAQDFFKETLQQFLRKKYTRIKIVSICMTSVRIMNFPIGILRWNTYIKHMPTMLLKMCTLLMAL